MNISSMDITENETLFGFLSDGASKSGTFSNAFLEKAGNLIARLEFACTRCDEMLYNEISEDFESESQGGNFIIPLESEKSEDSTDVVFRFSSEASSKKLEAIAASCFNEKFTTGLGRQHFKEARDFESKAIVLKGNDGSQNDGRRSSYQGKKIQYHSISPSLECEFSRLKATWTNSQSQEAAETQSRYQGGWQCPAIIPEREKDETIKVASLKDLQTKQASLLTDLQTTEEAGKHAIMTAIQHLQTSAHVEEFFANPENFAMWRNSCIKVEPIRDMIESEPGLESGPNTVEGREAPALRPRNALPVDSASLGIAQLSSLAFPDWMQPRRRSGQSWLLTSQMLQQFREQNQQMKEVVVRNKELEQVERQFVEERRWILKIVQQLLQIKSGYEKDIGDLQHQVAHLQGQEQRRVRSSKS